MTMARPAQTASRPSFTSLFYSYLSAYNTQSLSSTLAYLSHSCVSYYRTQPVLTTRQDFETAYRQHWEKNRGTKVEVDYIREFDSGVEVVLRESNGRTSVVRYYYGWEDGGYKQVRHEILEGV